MRINVEVGSEVWALYQWRQGKDIISWCTRWRKGFYIGETHYAIAKRVKFNKMLDEVFNGATALSSGGLYLSVKDGKLLGGANNTDWSAITLTDAEYNDTFLILPEDPNED